MEGIIERILNTVKQYIYGFIVLLDNIIGSQLEPATHTLLFGYPLGLLYDLMTFIYIMAAISLWTGKNYND